jgi:hypothetical protein
MQQGVGRSDREEFVVIESGAEAETTRTDALFHALAAQAARPKSMVSVAH